MFKTFFYSSVVLSALMAVGTLTIFTAAIGSSEAILPSAALAPTAEVLEKSPETPVASLFFVGDIMLGRNVEGLTDKHGDDYPFEKIHRLIQSVDFAFANLEGPIVNDHTKTPTGSFVFSFKDTSAEVLARAGFDGVSLANNHTLNQGDDGFEETEQFLDAAHILHVGHPIDMSENFVAHIAVKGIPLTFVGFNMTFQYDDPDAAVATVEKLSAASDDQIIVMMHWGNEYQPHSDSIQEKLAHRLIDAGADLIIGAHPHVVQEVEEYNGKLIFYSLGNFVFDQYFSVETQEELGVQIDLTTDGVVSATLYPIESVLSQPGVMEEPKRTVFLEALAERSSESISPPIQSGRLTF